MKNVSKLCCLTLMLMLFTVLAACGPKQIAVQDHTFTVDISELEQDMSESPHIVYSRPGAPELGDYNRFIVDPVLIIYSDPQMKELSTEQVGEMQQYFRNAVIEELRNGGYEVGTKSQAKTLRISLAISGLKAPSAASNITSAVVPLAVSVGEVTIEGVFRESLTNRIDGVVVSHSRGSRVLNPKPWTTWGDVESSFDNWAKGFREAVDKAHDQ